MNMLSIQVVGVGSGEGGGLFFWGSFCRRVWM
jgi:hypothetical protein